MKDASRGTFEERQAAYRHNRRMRGDLRAAMARWVLGCAVAVVLTQFFDSLGSGGAGPLTIFDVLAAVCATFIVCAICVLFVMAYVYLYLTYNDS